MAPPNSTERNSRGHFTHLPCSVVVRSRARPSPPPPLARTRSEAQPELDDHYLVALAKRGSADAYDRLIRRYRGFVRLKASSYFLLGGDSDDLIQEGTVGLYKAIRDYRTDRESSFRNFAELCITRQIITAVKTASRNKHAPLNQYVSFAQTPAAAGDSDTTLEEILPGPISDDPADRVIASEELSSLVACLGDVLSELESEVLVALPRRLQLRGGRRAARVRHEDGRQRPSARQAQGRHAHLGPRGPPLKRQTSRVTPYSAHCGTFAARPAILGGRLARVAQLEEQLICNQQVAGSSPAPGS